MDDKSKIEVNARIVEFLRSIGLQVVIEPGATGFAPGVRLVSGALHIDPSCAPSVLLHEAGHVSITPARYRSYMDGNLKHGIRRMIEEVIALDLPPDDPLERAVVQCSDPEATAWAWAAGLHLGIPPEQIILSHEYAGGGDDIRLMLQMNAYAGINGLAFAGMCRRGHAVPVESRYPVMQRWLQAH